MTIEPEDFPGGGGQRRPGTGPAPEGAPPAGAASGSEATPSPLPRTGAPEVAPVAEGAPAQTPAPGTRSPGAGHQSPPAQTSTTHSGLSSPYRSADGDTEAAGEETGGDSPAALRGEEFRKAWKRAETANNARQRNQRGRRPRTTPRPQAGMHRMPPPDGGSAA